MRPLTIAIFLSIISSASIHAAASNQHEMHHKHHEHDEEHQHTNQKPHVHGIATLTLAIGARTVELMFESPAANIVGFEHQANSHNEIEKVKEAEKLLSEHNKLFYFKGSQCTLEQHSVDTSGLLKPGLLKEQHDNHKESTTNHAPKHREIVSNYQFACSDLKNLESVSILIQDYFSRIERLDVMWVTQNQQGLDTLHESHKIIHFGKKQ